MHTKETLAELKALARRLNVEYTGDPNITGVGWGMAQRGGELRAELSLVFYVREKLADPGEAAARGTKAIPKEIEGFPTDVVVRGKLVRQQMAGRRNDELYDPLRGGVATSNLEQLDRTFFWSEGSVGTLGVLCLDGEGRTMALSNWHVWADMGAQNGDRIVQPSTPTGGGYAEGVAKTVLCGPAIGSLLEGRVPSGLAAGLYGAAAAAAALAALTDVRDPFRRGQDATPQAATAITHRERLDVELEHPSLDPWPGSAFATGVKWVYQRATNQGQMQTGVEEVQVNPQVLRGYAVAPDRSAYERGDTISVQSALWDYQSRPDDAYHVVANLVSAEDPGYHLHLVLHAAECRPVNLVPPYPNREWERTRPVRVGKEGRICLDFGYYPAGQVFPAAHNFGPIAVADYAGESLRMADLIPGTQTGLLIEDTGILVQHAPAAEVVVQVAHHGERPVRVRAYDAFERVAAEAMTPGLRDVVHELVLAGAMITHVHIDGGAGEAELLHYCFHPVGEGGEEQPPSPLPEGITAGLRAGSAAEPLACIGFGRYAPNAVFASPHEFGSVTIADNHGTNLHVVGWPDTEPNSLSYAREGLTITHAAASRVVLRTGQFTGEQITVQAFNAAGDLVDRVVKSTPNLVEELELVGEGIVRVTITGGGNEAIIVRYCYAAEDQEPPARSLLRCFRGHMELPQDAPLGRWIVYLVVQNINHVPAGTAPEQAATVIGGHVMGPSAQVLGCGFMLLGDHVFDIF
jgi:hypothetical protein